MNAGVYKTLEFNKILEILESFASTPPGRDQARCVNPSPDAVAVRASLGETTEARRLLEKGKEIPLAGTPDIRLPLESMQIENRPLGVEELLALAALVRTGARVKAQLLPERSELHLLPAIAERLPDLDPLRAAIERAIDPETREVRDDASPELRSLRARLFKMRQRLRNLLESYFKQKDSRRILQEQVITVRNGRSVLPVRAECRGQLMGIVHGASASGATLFIEPFSTVEINNDIVSLEEEERQEVERILLALTGLARAEGSALSEAAAILARLDLIQAKALLSQAYRGVEPCLSEGKTLRLGAARHPLLIGRMAEGIGQPPPAREAVPLSFQVNDERSALVFTGPNTGGKTVALKTAGLLSLMVQAGLHVPAAAESTFPVFKEIFADIGDEQSIGSSLSTFSFHLRNIVEMERGLRDPSLVLLDEVGTGTDPAEGGPLGVALIDHFRRRGALVLASTHHGMLKAYATTTAGVGSASFEFDPETYAPTYRLVEGPAGKSLAFEMARRLGLPEEIVARGRELQSQKERQLQEMMERLEAERKALDRDRERLIGDRREMAFSLRHQRELEQEHAERRESHLRIFQQELERELAQARARLKNILDDARERIASEPASAVSRAQKAVAEADRHLEALAGELVPATPARTPYLRPEVRLGERVSVASLGVTGVVAEILGSGDVEVMVRDKKLRIPVSELELAPAPAEATFPRAASGPGRLPERKQAPQELNVIGCTVDEALSQADKFLDDAFLSEHRTVRLIHGHGQGILKRAIADWLTNHPHVASHQAEPSGAVTLVELKV